MKKILLLALALACCGPWGCTSVEVTTVSSSDIATPGGQAIAVVQAESVGFTAIFQLIDIVSSNLDQVVNKLLVSEAKAMGGSKVELLNARTTPRHGVFALEGGLISFIAGIPPSSSAVGIVIQ